MYFFNKREVSEEDLEKLMRQSIDEFYKGKNLTEFNSEDNLENDEIPENQTPEKEELSGEGGVVVNISKEKLRRSRTNSLMRRYGDTQFSNNVIISPNPSVAKSPSNVFRPFNTEGGLTKSSSSGESQEMMSSNVFLRSIMCENEEDDMNEEEIDEVFRNFKSEEEKEANVKTQEVEDIYVEKNVQVEKVKKNNFEDVFSSMSKGDIETEEDSKINVNISRNSLPKLSQVFENLELNDDSILAKVENSPKGKPKRKNIKNVLKSLQLEHYLPEFTKRKIIYEDLEFLKSIDLANIIPDTYPRRRLKRYIRENLKSKKKDEKPKQKWELSPNSIDIERSIIGTGGFARVKKGKYKIGMNSIEIAIKEIVLSHIVKRENVINEIMCHCKLKHENVLKCFGCFFSKGGIANVVLEYCEKGSIEEILKEKREKFKLIQKIDFLTQISQGMSYIHENDIIHSLCSKFKNRFAVLYHIHQDHVRPDLTMLGEDVPKEVIDLMKKCWQKDPGKRPKTFGDVTAALRVVYMELKKIEDEEEEEGESEEEEEGETDEEEEGESETEEEEEGETDYEDDEEEEEGESEEEEEGETDEESESDSDEGERKSNFQSFFSHDINYQSSRKNKTKGKGEKGGRRQYLIKKKKGPRIVYVEGSKGEL